VPAARDTEPDHDRGGPHRPRGCALIATGGYAAAVAGFGLAQLQSVLDGCDGELARVRFQQSAIGEWLDTITDDVLTWRSSPAGPGLANSGARRSGGGPRAGRARASRVLFYNVVAYRELRRQGEGGEVLKVRWWFAPRGDMKGLAGHTKKGPLAFLYNLGGATSSCSSGSSSPSHQLGVVLSSGCSSRELRSSWRRARSWRSSTGSPRPS